MVRRMGGAPQSPHRLAALGEWLFEQAQKIQAASQARIRPRQYQMQPPDVIRVTPGDPTTVELYGSPYTQASIDISYNFV